MIIFNQLIIPLIEKEKVLIITEDYEIKGWLYNIGLLRTNRFLSDLLNRANKNFIAIKNCEITYKNKQGQIELLDFLQLNMKYIILIRPLKENE